MTSAKHSSDSVEHYTPTDIVEAARITLGAIDLDPASCALANETVRADRIFTREDDGLSRPWFGRVFLNPPGGKDGNESRQKAWWFHLANEWTAGRVTEAIFVGFSVEILQTTQVESLGALPLDFPMCFPRTRVAYNRPLDPAEDRKQHALFPAELGPSQGIIAGTQPPHASVIVCLPHGLIARNRRATKRRFFEAFGALGRCIDGGGI